MVICLNVKVIYKRLLQQSDKQGPCGQDWFYVHLPASAVGSARVNHDVEYYILELIQKIILCHEIKSLNLS